MGPRSPHTSIWRARHLLPICRRGLQKKTPPAEASGDSDAEAPRGSHSPAIGSATSGGHVAVRLRPRCPRLYFEMAAPNPVVGTTGAVLLAHPRITEHVTMPAASRSLHTSTHDAPGSSNDPNLSPNFGAGSRTTSMSTASACRRISEGSCSARHSNPYARQSTSPGGGDE